MTKERLLKNLSGIDTLCRMIEIYYLNSLKGTRFRSPRIESKAKKINEFAVSIRKSELKGFVKMEEDFMYLFEYEHTLQLWRIIDHFLYANTDDLERIADELESLNN